MEVDGVYIQMESSKNQPSRVLHGNANNFISYSKERPEDYVPLKRNAGVQTDCIRDEHLGGVETKTEIEHNNDTLDTVKHKNCEPIEIASAKYADVICHIKAVSPEIQLLPFLDISQLISKRRKVMKLEENNDNNEQQHNENNYDNQQPGCSKHFNSSQRPSKIANEIMNNVKVSPIPQNSLAKCNIIKRALEEANNTIVAIGKNGTFVPRKIYDSIKWSNASMATRKLLSALFQRETLATHTLSAQVSPAFKGPKTTKPQLNSIIIGDIISEVMNRCGVSRVEVRASIESKCVDESKKLKKRNIALLNESKENNPLNYVEQVKELTQ